MRFGALSVVLLLALALLAGVGLVEWKLAGAAPIGDANCDNGVNSIDAALVLQQSAGLIGAVPCENSADVNADGVANPLDAALILQFTAGLIYDLEPRPTTPTPGTKVVRYYGAFQGGTVSFSVSYNCFGGACLSETQVNGFNADRSDSCAQDIQVGPLIVQANEFYFEYPSSVVAGAGFAVSGVLGPHLQPPVAAGEAVGTLSFYGCELYDIPWTASAQ